MDNSYREWILIYLKGFLMGSADAIPGISGGTIALITGIYSRMISAVTSVKIQNTLTIIQGFRPSKLRESIQAFHRIDGFFLICLGSGVLTALILVLNIIHFLLTNYAIMTFGFFWGVIAVSAIVLSKQVNYRSSKSMIAALTGFVLSFTISGVASTSLGHGNLILFISGALAVSAMILPGISGSLLLIILGQYEYMSGILSAFTEAVVSAVTSGQLEQLINNLWDIGVFVSGGIFGLFTIAHFIRWALENYRQITFAFLISLVLGALRAPILEVEKVLLEDQLTWLNVLPEFGSMAILGGLLIFVIDYKAGVIEL